MQNFLITVHVLLAIFAVGPLAHAATTAARGVRAGDGRAVAASARTVRIYGFVTILVAVAGFGLLQPKWDNRFSAPWVWVSLILFVAALALVFAVLLPSLEKVAVELGGGAATGTAAESPTAGTAVSAATSRIAASGGVIALLFAVIVVLMVFKPGQ